MNKLDQEICDFFRNNSWKNSLKIFIIIVTLSFLLVLFQNTLANKFEFLSTLFRINLINGVIYMFPFLIFLYYIKSRKTNLKHGLRYFRIIPNNTRDVINVFYYFVFVVIAFFIILISFTIAPYMQFEKIKDIPAIKENELKILPTVPGLIGGFTINLLDFMVKIGIPEELFFRAFVQSFLYFFFVTAIKNIKNIPLWSSILSISLSAIIFMLFHLISIFETFKIGETIFYLRLLNLFLGGVFFGFIFLRTKNLWLTIFIHSGWDAFADTTAFFLSKHYEIMVNMILNFLIHNGIISPEVSLELFIAISNLLGI